MEKNKTTTLILCVALGYLGIHRFYVGKNKSGILYLCTMGLCGIGWIVDIVLICTDRFTDWNGRSLAGASSSSSTDISTSPSPVRFEKTVWNRYESEGKKHLKKNDYGLYRNTRFHMAKYLQSIQDYEGAISMY